MIVRLAATGCTHRDGKADLESSGITKCDFYLIIACTALSKRI